MYENYIATSGVVKKRLPFEVKLKKQETAGDKKKKRSAELAANKAKSRSRSSLKIG